MPVQNSRERSIFNFACDRRNRAALHQVDDIRVCLRACCYDDARSTIAGEQTALREKRARALPTALEQLALACRSGPGSLTIDLDQ